MTKKKNPPRRVTKKCARCKKLELSVFGKDENLCAFCFVYNPKK